MVEEERLAYSVALGDDGCPEGGKTYLRLPPPNRPYTLRLTIEPGSSASRRAVFKTTFPIDGQHFERSRFCEIRIPFLVSESFNIDIKVDRAGIFEYHVDYHSTETGERTRSPTAYFSVDPLLQVQRRSQVQVADGQITGGDVETETCPLPLDGIVLQTVIAKWMGTFNQWQPHLDIMRRRGYNMIHYTPLQQRGASNSPYSIFDQLQFADGLFEAGTTADAKPKIVEQWLARVRREWGMLGMIDIVLNHTAHNSEFLLDHPEAGYSVANSPHLRAAVELDKALLRFSAELKNRQLPTVIESETDIDKIMTALEKELLPELKLWQYYVIDTKAAKQDFAKAWVAGLDESTQRSHASQSQLEAAFRRECLTDDAFVLGDRYQTKVMMSRAVPFVAQMTGLACGSESLDQAKEVFQRLLDAANLPQYKLFDQDLTAILENTKNRLRYTRLDSHGPRYGEINAKSPIVESLFTYLPVGERTSQHGEDALALANNGWIWDADPLQDFASSASRTYLRRDLIVWGDCVKLRYGRDAADNPWLWDHMTKYVELLATLFDGFRLDNCHSTPLHVGEALLDAARRKNPNLYVCAELFTGSEETDLVFVTRLGINSLIREAMNANDPKEQSSLLYRFGLGKPIGSLDEACLKSTATIDGSHVTVIPHPGSRPHALLMDVTHDNESPLSKRTAEDALSTGALVTFAYAAIGSNRGFDDLYPKLLDVVGEDRLYDTQEAGRSDRGIGLVKQLLNNVHQQLANIGAVEGHFSQEDDIITAHRVDPRTRKGWLLVARTAISKSAGSGGSYNPITLEATDVAFKFGAQLKVTDSQSRDTSDVLRGLDNTLVMLPSPAIREVKDGDVRRTEIDIPQDFAAGSILVFETALRGMSDDLDETCLAGADQCVSQLTGADINCLLFRAEGEEHDLTPGNGAYKVPGMDDLVFCGLQGWIPALHHIVTHNDLGHPLCQHLREGLWPLDYVSERLARQLDYFPNLQAPIDWIRTRANAVKALPAFLRPRYFAAIIIALHRAGVRRYIDTCSTFVQSSPAFTKSLALVSAQMYGLVRSASLSPKESIPSLAAGLPHFSAGWARTWGRDVFISLRGLFLVTGKFDEAEQHILSFCSVVKHGLIPNLLDSGRTPRYNSRDSPWFMLQNIQDFVTMAPNGIDILAKPVKRRFPVDDTWVDADSPQAYASSNTVAEIIQEIIQRHAAGIHFREHNAGPNLDMQMSDKGFNIDIEVDWSTGVIYGGNEWNCGTWQDKMGESAKAGNKGHPGTSRHGAPIEITGLLHSTLVWLSKLPQSAYPFRGVETSNGHITFDDWSALLRHSFERLYYVPADAKEDNDHFVHPKFVQRRGIYKDVHTSPQEHHPSDYQLRSNFPIAMAVSPQLFNPAHAWTAIQTAQKELVGPLGMKTLDSADPNYRGFYNNSEDSDNYATAKGLNYHQGPEWGWPLGYYLRAYALFYNGQPKKAVNKSMQDQKEELTYAVHHLLRRQKQHMKTDKWAGLPELTNANGAYCHDSCATQAWSASTILDALYDLTALS